MKNVKPLRAFAAPDCAFLADWSRVQGNSDTQRCGNFGARWFCRALMVAFVLWLQPSANSVQAQTVALSTPLTVAQRFDAALLAYERNHWPEAYAALSALADSGHPEAARMALQMLQYGPALYGRRFVASAGQVALWKRSWGCSSDPSRAGCQAIGVP